MAAPAGLLSGLTAPLRAVGRAYNAHAQRRPFAVGTVTTVVKTSAADAFAQLVLEDRSAADFDLKRHGLFCAFGLFYLGGFQYYLYNHLFVRWCAGITAAVGHKGAAPVKTFIDQAIHHPFAYFPAFYGLKGAVEGRPLSSTWDRYRAELWDNCKALWTIWVPAQLVNFAFVPRHLRIPYVAGVSFAWTVVLSAMRGAAGRGARRGARFGSSRGWEARPQGPRRPAWGSLGQQTGTAVQNAPPEKRNHPLESPHLCSEVAGWRHRLLAPWAHPTSPYQSTGGRVTLPCCFSRTTTPPTPMICGGSLNSVTPPHPGCTCMQGAPTPRAPRAVACASLTGPGPSAPPSWLALPRANCPPPLIETALWPRRV